MYDKEYVNNIIYTSVAPLCIFSHSPIPNIFPFQQPIYQYLLIFKARELEGINCMDGRLYNNFATITFYRKEANYSKAGSSNNDFQIICKSKWPIAWAAVIINSLLQPCNHSFHGQTNQKIVTANKCYTTYRFIYHFQLQQINAIQLTTLFTTLLL